MTNYEIYVFFLCLVVFILLTVTFGVLLSCIVKQDIRLIRCGEEDNAIKIEYEKATKRKATGCVVNTVLSLLLCVALVAVLVFSLCVNTGEASRYENIPTYKVVNSGSMAEKIPSNKHLFTNGLNDQIQTFDLILTYKLPDEFDLQLYDIVVYEVESTLVVHRIVGIEEPNANHPNERWFTLQGDAVERPDRFPVHYDQMRGIYRGERIPFVGSFILFMQSPAGWLCVLLIAFATFATPMAEKKLRAEKEKRLPLILETGDPR
ncbi:MAG: hypothetical protein IKA63_06840 [Clostridia bacterium]|nr:hypothetical protein [Clostridia bacterium]